MTASARLKLWWKHAVIYQIYPASYCDSEGDGIGDLPGITSKLDYIASLGVNVIWICSMYDSPQIDMGYEIANYEDVCRPYGTVQDMEMLIRGSTWEWDEQTGEYYLHLFAKEQPDINWENPIARKALYASSMEFWLQRGVDGFRIDTVNMYSHLLAFWCTALLFRREHADLLVYGDYRAFREEDKDVHVFLKEAPHGGSAKALVVLNFTAAEKQWEQPTAEELELKEGVEVKLVPLLSTHGKKVTDHQALDPFEGRVYLVD